jgi:hypothetical protein
MQAMSMSSCLITAMAMAESAKMDRVPNLMNKLFGMAQPKMRVTKIASPDQLGSQGLPSTLLSIGDTQSLLS